MTQKMTTEANRIVEAYVGEYASGKSEVAINRALDLHQLGQQVSLIDLDYVEPCYTLRPLKNQLSQPGLEVITWETKDTFGLGEAGSTLLPAVRWALRRPSSIIFDVGYGVHGAATLNLVEGLPQEAALQIILVLNTSRPITNRTEDIMAYIQELGRVDAIISNTHMAEETSPDIVLAGIEKAKAIAKSCQKPLIAYCLDQDFCQKYPDWQYPGLPLRVLQRYMPQSFW